MNLLPGHEKCGIAIGNGGGAFADIIDGINEPTFGYGKLNEYGYWQYPCYECAREWERQNPESGKAWPYSNEEIDRIRTNKKQKKKYAYVKENQDEEEKEEILDFL